MDISHLVCFFSCILVALAGECLQDSNTGHGSSAWAQELWSYSPASAKAASTSSTLNFMTYNLQSSISNACVSNPTQQAQLMTWADYVGNNEVAQGVDTRCNCVMEKIIADTTGFNTRFVMTFPWRTGQYGIGSGTSQQILDTQYLLYNYAGAEQRALLALKTQPAGLGGNALWFITTHVDYTVAAARESEVNQLISWVRTNIIAKDPKASVVAVGDFNAGPWDPFYNNMKALFKNAWEVYHGGIGDGNTYPSDSPSVRFDHIWYYVPSGFTAQPTYVEVVNVQNSDHRPLRATIKFTYPGGSPSTPAPATPAPATPSPATPAPPKGATSAPVTPAPATQAPSTPASSSANAITVQVHASSSAYWFAVSIAGGASAPSSVSLKDGGSYRSYTAMSTTTYGYFIFQGNALTLPISLLVTSASGSVELVNVVTSYTQSTVNTGKQYGGGSSSPSTSAPTTQAPATQAPATHAPATQAPATSAPATPAPPKGATSAPVTPAPSSGGGGTCTVSISYNTAGNNIVIKNTGSKAIKSINLTFSPSVPSNNWNLVATSTSNVLTLPSYAYSSLQTNGQTYSSSGFYATGAMPTITASSVTC